jgi:hypothetical protein
MAPPRSPDEPGSALATPKIGTGRAVEVLHDRGPTVTAGTDRWMAGSGYLIGGRLVLTAAHNVDYRRDLGDDEQLLVRRIDGSELDARVVLVCDEPSKVDLALLEIIHPEFDEIRPPVTVARVNRDSPALVAGCWAVGFPRFGEAGPVLAEGSRRETWHVHGEIPPGGKLRAGLLALQVTSTPRPLPGSLSGSEWEGMSGAVVFATDPHDGELAVGVVTTHHRPEGESALAVVPITAIAELPTDAQWWRQLGVPDPDTLPVLPRQLSPVAAISLVTGGYERLEDVRQYTDRLVAKLDLRHFTGREWLLHIIDDFLHSEDRGYFVLEATVGLGKTTFCAWLARSRHYPVHFVQIPGGADSAATLKNLAAQLIDICRLNDVAPDGVLPPTVGSPNGFARLLAEAARRAQQAGRPLVLVVDGLNDVHHRFGDMPLGLPVDPPPGVYLVVSRQPGDQMLPVEAPRRYFTLQGTAEPDQPPVPNQQDMLDYLRQVADEPPLAGLLAAAHLSADAFVGPLAAKCAGVWIYLRYVLEEMRRHLRPITDLDTLPDTLWQYYARTFARSRQEDPGQWQAVLLPLLATLGAAREPVTFDLLCTLAGVQADERCRMVLDGPWRPFLQVQDEGLDAEPRYAVYHDSLREFLEGRLAEEALAQMTAERPLIRQLHHALRDRRSWIVDRYLSAWGGLGCGLPDLEAAPGLGGMDGGYGLRSLTWHLLKADREADLHQLLACGPPGRNTWFTAHDSTGDVTGYLEDVRKARSSAQQLGTQLRYAVIEASIASLSTTLPPVLIEQLVARDPEWTASRAFSHIERMADDQRQAQGLARIASVLPGELLGRALSVAIGCRTEEGRATALQALIPRLPGNLLERAADAVLGIENDDVMLAPLVAITARLPDELLRQLPSHATRLWGVRAVCLWAATALFSSDDRPQGGRTALALTRDVHNKYERGLLVAALLPHLPEDAFYDVLGVLGTIADDDDYLDAPLIALAKDAPAERLSKLLDFATGRWRPKPEFFRQLARRITSEHLPAALRLCQAGSSDQDKAESFAALAPLLDTEQARSLLAPREGDISRRWLHRRAVVVEDLNLFDGEHEPHVVSALIDRLPEPERADAVAELMPDLSRRELELPRDAKAFAWFARYLPGDLRRRALTLIYMGMSWTEGTAEEYAPFLTRFAPFSDDEVAEAFTALENAYQISWWPGSCLMAADVLAPHLSNGQLRYALARVMAFPLEEECFAALAELGRYQPQSARDQTCERGLDMANGISHGKFKARAVAALAPIIARPELADKAFEILWSVRPYWGVRAMEAMADVLPVARLREVPEKIRGSRAPDPALDIPKILKRLSDKGYTTVIDDLIPRPEDSWHPSQSEGITGLAPVLSPSQARRAWHIPEPKDFGPSDAEALSVLVGRLPEHERAAAADEVLAAWTPRVHPDEREAQILGKLARAASTDRLTQALREYLSRTPTLSDKVLKELAPGLPEMLIGDAFQYALCYDPDSCRALAKLAPRLSGSLLTQAISHVKESVGLAGRTAALTALARQLPPDDDQDRETVLSMALEAAISNPWNSMLDGVMADLIPQLPERLRPLAVNATVDGVCSDLRSHQQTGGEQFDRLRAVLAVLRGLELEQLYVGLRELEAPRVRARAQAAVIRRAAEDHASGFFSGQRLHHDWPGDLNRAGLMDLIAGAAWWIHGDGGVAAVDEVIEAIFVAVGWWP